MYFVVLPRHISFPASDLLSNAPIVRYVQSDNEHKEPRSDSFTFHVSDGLNRSPDHTVTIQIQVLRIGRCRYLCFEKSYNKKKIYISENSTKK